MHFTKREKKILLSKKPRKFLISSVENRSNTSPERISNKCLEINAAQPSQSDDLDFNRLWLHALKRCCPSEYLARNKCAGSATKAMSDIDPTLDLLQSWWMGTEDLRGLELRSVPSLSYRLRKFRRQATESVLEKYTTVMANQGYLPHSTQEMIATKYHEDSEPASKFAQWIAQLDAIVAASIFISNAEADNGKQDQQRSSSPASVVLTAESNVSPWLDCSSSDTIMVHSS
jgi:hypothetical protein